MRRFGLGAFLALILLVGAVGIVAYDLGISAGTTDAAIEAGASVIYAPATFSPFGAIVGAFFLIVLIGFIVRGFGASRRPMGRRGWSHGGGFGGYPGHRDSWEQGSVPEPFRPMLERWHREAHAAPLAGAPTAAQRPDAQPGTAAPPPGPRPA